MREITNISTRLFLLLTVELTVEFLLPTSYKSQIDGSEVEQIDQVKIFHLLASVVFNHFSLQILTNRDAENVLSTTLNPLLVLIIFILNSEFV